MSYLVFARKYRPVTFDDVVGQKAAVTTLKNAIRSDRVAHAYLFAGPRGVGKTSMARILSKALNCENGPTEEPCNKCDICLCVSNGSDVDVLEIDGASNRGIDEIRNIRQNVNYAPTRARYKIYIIDEVHMLTKEAFNALLKTLEEPPRHVKFIFATTGADKLPETVQSRCQRFDFKNISMDDLEGEIAKICKKEKIEAEDEVFHVIAKYARGGLRDALSVLDQIISFSEDKVLLSDVYAILGLIEEDRMFEIVDAVLKNDLKCAVQAVEGIFAEGKGASEFIDQFIWYIRDMLLAHIYKGDLKKNRTLFESQIKLLTAHKDLSVDMLTYMIQVISDVKKRAKDELHKRILLEVAIIKLATTEDISPISDLLKRIDDIEKRVGGLANEGPGNFSVNRAAVIDVNNRQAVNQEVDNRAVESVSERNEPFAVETHLDDFDSGGLDIASGLENEQVDEAPSQGAATVTSQAQPAVEDATLSTVSTPDQQVVGSEASEGTAGGDTWSNILGEAQKAKKKSLWATLQAGRLVSCENGEIVIELPKECMMHKERLEGRPDERKMVEECAEAVLGEKVRAKFVLAEKESEQSLKAAAARSAAYKSESEATGGNENKPAVEARPTQDVNSIKDENVQKAVEIFEGRIVDIQKEG